MMVLDSITRLTQRAMQSRRACLHDPVLVVSISKQLLAEQRGDEPRDTARQPPVVPATRGDSIQCTCTGMYTHVHACIHMHMHIHVY